MVTQLIRKANKIQKVKSKIWTLSLKKLLTKLRVKLLNLLTKLRVRMLNPLTKLRVRMHNLLLMLKNKRSLDLDLNLRIIPQGKLRKYNKSNKNKKKK